MPKPELTRYDDDMGAVLLPENQREFMTWLATPKWERLPRYEKDWAAEHQLAADTVRKWKQKPVFKREFEKLLAKINVGPERLQAIVDTLYRKAISTEDRDQVKAAQLYMQYVDKLQPTKVIVERSERDTSDLSDEELAAELEASVYQLRAVRSDDEEIAADGI